MYKHSKYRLVLFTVIAAVAVRLFFVFVLSHLLGLEVGPRNPAYYSCDGYQELAKQMLHGHGYRFAENAPFTVFRAPLYPAVLAIFYKLTNENEIAVLLVNLLFGSAGCALCVVAAQHAFGRRVSILTAIGTVIYPQFLQYAWSIWSETFQFFFVSLFLLCTVLLFERRTLQMGAITGFCLALAVYSKGFLIAFPVVLVPALLFTQDKQLRRGWGSIAMLLLVSISLIAPWTIRNYLVTGRFIPVNTGNGYAYLIGNEYMTAGSGVDGTEAGYAVYNHFAEDRGLSVRTESLSGSYCDLGPEADVLYNRMAKRDVMRHPDFFIKKMLLGVPRVWYISQTRVKTLAAAVQTIPLLLIAIIGTPAILRRKVNCQPYYLLLIYGTLAFAMVQPHYRYSMPMAGALLTLAAAALVALSGRSFGDQPIMIDGTSRSLVKPSAKMDTPREPDSL